MTSEASLPADNGTEAYEPPIARVLKAAEEAEAARQAAERSPLPSESEETESPVDRVSEAMMEPPGEEGLVEEATEIPEPVSGSAEAEPTVDETPEVMEWTRSEEPAGEDIVEPNAASNPDGVSTQAMAAWTDALRSVERSINEASEAIRFLRSTIQEMAPLLRSVGGFEEALRGFEERTLRRPETRAFDEPLPAASIAFDDGASAAETEPTVPTPSRRDTGDPERDWPFQRKKTPAKERAPQREEAEPWAPPAGPPRPALKPVTLVPDDDTPSPFAYRVTIEDRKGPVELMQLHRAFTGITSVRNVSLLNYVNGIASLSIEASDEIDPLELENAVKKTMKRTCSVVPHESNVILIQVGE